MGFIFNSDGFFKKRQNRKSFDIADEFDFEFAESFDDYEDSDDFDDFDDFLDDNNHFRPDIS